MFSFFLYESKGESNGLVVNDCQWQSEPTLTETAVETDSPTGHQKTTHPNRDALFFISSTRMDHLRLSYML